METRTLSRRLAGVGLALALAACGTTVPTSQQQSAAGLGSSDGLGTTGGVSGTSPDGGGTDAGTPTDAGGTGAGAALTGTTSSTTGSVPSSDGSAGDGSTGGSGSTGATGPLSGAAKGKTIQVGIAYVKDAGPGAAAIGVQGTLGNMRLYAQLLVDDANQHGGLNGRKIVPVFFGYDVNPGSPSYPQQDAAACATFTQDYHVEVGVVTFAGDDVRACLGKRHIPMIQAGPTGGIGASTLQKYPELFVMGGLNLDRRANEEIRALRRQKYFTGWNTSTSSPGPAPVKVGIITYDLPVWKVSANALRDGVVAAGFPKPAVIAVAPHDSYDDLAKSQSQLSSAVLSFRASGVTHVIIWDDNGVSSLFFMNQAEGQKFRPRYGITSGNNMQLLSTGLVSVNQLKGSTGIGWVPHMDVAAAKSPTSTYSNSARKKCYALMKAKNATSTGFNEGTAMMYCAGIWALKDRWDHARLTTPIGLRPSFEAFGSSFVDPQVPASFMGPRQHDGAGGIYDYSYSTGCSCMTYTGGVQPLAHS